MWWEIPALFETAAAQLGIRHKLIRAYTPRHNGKVERSHHEDQKHFYSCHRFFSLDGFAKQRILHDRRSNNFPMRPINWLSPNEFTVQYVLYSYTLAIFFLLSYTINARHHTE